EVDHQKVALKLPDAVDFGHPLGGGVGKDREQKRSDDELEDDVELEDEEVDDQLVVLHHVVGRVAGWWGRRGPAVEPLPVEVGLDVWKEIENESRVSG